MPARSYSHNSGHTQLSLLDLLPDDSKALPIHIEANYQVIAVVGQQAQQTAVEQKLQHQHEEEKPKSTPPRLAKIQLAALESLIEDVGPIPEPVNYNQHEQRQHNRRERLEKASDRASARSSAAYQSSNAALAGIEPGQPILVGHHSEKHHRRAVQKSHNRMQRSVDEGKKAAYYAEKAKSVGKAGISSTDPDADRKLKLKLLSKMIDQEVMKAANAVVRSKSKKKFPDRASKLKALSELGIGRANAEQLFEPYLGKIGFPSYLLTNNNGAMRQVRQRIKDVQQLQYVGKESTEYAIAEGFVRVEQSLEEGLIMLENDGEPSCAVKSIYEACGFKWSSLRQQWVRKLTQNAITAVSLIETELDNLGATNFWPKPDEKRR